MSETSELPEWYVLPSDIPNIRITYDNGLGDVATYETTLNGNSIGLVVESMKLALLGFGFHPDTVNEYFPEE